jgi:hypothetical protein
MHKKQGMEEVSKELSRNLFMLLLHNYKAKGTVFHIWLFYYVILKNCPGPSHFGRHPPLLILENYWLPQFSNTLSPTLPFTDWALEKPSSKDVLE